MSSKLIYLGLTNKSYRIALVDTQCMPSVRVPVKDCSVLPDIPFVNCTVVGGIPNLNLVNQWDGICKEDNWYVLGKLTLEQDTYKSDNSYVCINYEGVVAVFKLADMKQLSREFTFVYMDSLSVRLRPEECETNFRYTLREVANDVDKAYIKAVWSDDLRGEISFKLRDLRKYETAEVFGLYLNPSYRIYIFPETAKIIWLGFICNSACIQAMYIPKGIECLYEVLVDKRKLKKVTFYSNSPKVFEFANKVGAKYIRCESAEAMLDKERIPTISTKFLGTSSVVTQLIKNENAINLVGGCTKESQVSSLLVTLGIPVHLLGYNYLRDCILEVISDMSLLHSITKDVYPRVAIKYKTTSNGVERAIQHATLVAWRSNAAETINRLFGCNVNSMQKRPSNCKFIALIADKVNMEMTKISYSAKI